MIKGVETLVTDQVYRSTASPIASRRPPTRHEFLAAKGDASVTPTSCPDVNDGFVDEDQCRLSWKMES
jgi:hypothetical protein